MLKWKDILKLAREGNLAPDHKLQKSIRAWREILDDEVFAITRLSATDSQMWFILESLPEMPIDALHAAGDELAAGLQEMMPGSIIRSSLLTV